MKLSEIQKGMKIFIIQDWTDGTANIISGEVCTIDPVDKDGNIIKDEMAIRADGYVRIVNKTLGVDGYRHHYGRLFRSIDEVLIQPQVKIKYR